MSTSIDDIHHRNGQSVPIRSVSVQIERTPAFLRSGLGNGQGNAKQRISPETPFVGRSIQPLQEIVDVSLIGHVMSNDGWGNVSHHMCHRYCDPFTTVPFLVSITLLECLLHSGRCP